MAARPGDRSPSTAPGPSAVEEKSPRVSVVVPTYNGRSLVLECLAHLEIQSRPPDEIVVVDDGSGDGTSAAIPRAFPETRLVRLHENRGFCRAANAGIDASTGEYVALLNNDARPERHWLHELVAAAERMPDVGACASKILTDTDPPVIESAGDTYRPWRSPRGRGAGSPADRFGCPGPVFAASAAAALYRRSALEEVGIFDEDLGSYYEDVDLSFRLRLAGYDVWYVATAIVRHRGHATAEERRILHQVLRNDPLVYAKDMPAPFFWLFLPALLARQVYQLLYYAQRGKGRLCLAAKLEALCSLPTFLTKRSEVSRIRRSSCMALLRATAVPDNGRP